MALAKLYHEFWNAVENDDFKIMDEIYDQVRHQSTIDMPYPGMRTFAQMFIYAADNGLYACAVYQILELEDNDIEKFIKHMINLGNKQSIRYLLRIAYMNEYFKFYEELVISAIRLDDSVALRNVCEVVSERIDNGFYMDDDVKSPDLLLNHIIQYDAPECLKFVNCYFNIPFHPELIEYTENISPKCCSFLRQFL